MVPEHGGNFANLEGFAGAINVNISDMRDLNSLNTMVRDKDFVF